MLERLYPMTNVSVIAHYVDKESETILDLGCGKGDIMASLKRRGYKGAAIGGDVFLRYLKVCKTCPTYNDCVLLDARYPPFREKSIDLILFIGVIEHLGKGDGLVVLEELDRLSKKRIIVLTSSGFLPQDSFDCNIYQEHKSGWFPEEFRKRGYKVYGVSRIKRAPYAIKSKIGKKISALLIAFPLLRFVSQPFVYTKPEIAFHMVCVKNLPP